MALLISEKANVLLINLETKLPQNTHFLLLRFYFDLMYSYRLRNKLDFTKWSPREKNLNRSNLKLNYQPTWNDSAILQGQSLVKFERRMQKMQMTKAVERNNSHPILTINRRPGVYDLRAENEETREKRCFPPWGNICGSNRLIASTSLRLVITRVGWLRQCVSWECCTRVGIIADLMIDELFSVRFERRMMYNFD